MLAIIFSCLLLLVKKKNLCHLKIEKSLRTYDFIGIEFQLFYSEVKVCARIRTKYDKLEKVYFGVFWGEVGTIRKSDGQG